ncbi:MAG: glycosyltransferase [Solirubrobacterales bacterium]|nr:glycosyltransferase [Solirubrobacterales bacterium]OJU95120.1 MAG: hypothetical protein BGO23_10575 [Solirubrobacterales bacterium 67-14]
MVDRQPEAEPLVAVCMATYEPDLELLRVQIDSIRSQGDTSWVCVISDDCSSPDRFAAIEAMVEGDPRFTVSRSESRLGFYRNFERAIELAPPEAELIALADQDDRWYEDKLATLRRAIAGAGLAYSDQRLTSPDGTVIAGTYWTVRRNNYTNLTSLLVANTVTGAAMMFTREVADLALPFPEVPGEQYHDHWIALVAMAVGDLAYVDRPLYDYHQHGGAVLGHQKANLRATGGGLVRLDPRRWRSIFDGWASAYFDVYLRLKALAQTLIERVGPRMPAAKKRMLERFIASDRALSGPIWLELRSLRPWVGHNETMGVERILARAVIYRHLAAVKRRLSPALGRRRPTAGGLKVETEVTPQMRQKVAPLFPVVSRDQPRRINLLIPSIDLEHFFGGYIAKFNLARRLAEHGARVRVVTVDPTLPVPSDWKERIEGYAELEGVFDQIEVAFGRDGREPLLISPDDRFIATTWWTAHIASRLARSTGQSRFLYMIQEYEPLTVPEGAWRRLAEESYELPHNALFSTGILEDYFALEGIGVFAEGEIGRDRALHFDNAITAVETRTAEKIEACPTPKLLFYARPEPHAARNLYEQGIAALNRAIAKGAFAPPWRIVGIGTLGGVQKIELEGGRELELLPRTSQGGYASLLAQHDVGLALMGAPHPSLVPIEMASAGMPVVTTVYGEAKDAEALTRISPNLIPVPAEQEAIVSGLLEAERRAGDIPARLAGAELTWPTSWSQSFDEETLTRIADLIEKA